MSSIESWDLQDTLALRDRFARSVPQSHIWWALVAYPRFFSSYFLSNFHFIFFYQRFGASGVIGEGLEKISANSTTSTVRVSIGALEIWEHLFEQHEPEKVIQVDSVYRLKTAPLCMEVSLCVFSGLIFALSVFFSWLKKFLFFLLICIIFLPIPFVQTFLFMHFSVFHFFLIIFSSCSWHSSWRFPIGVQRIAFHSPHASYWSLKLSKMYWYSKVDTKFFFLSSVFGERLVLFRRPRPISFNDRIQHRERIRLKWHCRTPKPMWTSHRSIGCRVSYKLGRLPAKSPMIAGPRHLLHPPPPLCLSIYRCHVLIWLRSWGKEPFLPYKNIAIFKEKFSRVFV